MTFDIMVSSWYGWESLEGNDMNKDNVKAVISILKNGASHDKYMKVVSCLDNAWYDKGFVYATDRFRIVRIPVKLDVPDMSYIGVKELSAWVNAKGRSVKDDIDWSSLAWQKPKFSFPRVSALFDEALYDNTASLNPYVSFNTDYMMDGMRFLSQREYASKIPCVDIRFQHHSSAIKPVWMENESHLVYLLVPIRK